MNKIITFPTLGHGPIECDIKFDADMQVVGGTAYIIRRKACVEISNEGRFKDPCSESVDYLIQSSTDEIFLSRREWTCVSTVRMPE